MKFSPSTKKNKNRTKKKMHVHVHVLSTIFDQLWLQKNPIHFGKCKVAAVTWTCPLKKLLLIF